MTFLAGVWAATALVHVLILVREESAWRREFAKPPPWPVRSVSWFFILLFAFLAVADLVGA